MRFFYTIALLLASHGISFSQTVLIKGKVKADNDSALAGASISVKGRSIATVTNARGEFSIYVAKLPDTLTFSSVGYKTIERILKAKDSAKFIVVNLFPIESSLDEVVVVGYAAKKKMVMTGSVSSSLEGRVAGISSHKAEKSVRTRDAATTKAPVVRRKSSDLSPLTTKALGSQSKILTAGELSDFKKWSLWEGYTKAEFKEWSEHWGIAPVKRYCVQVQNQDRIGIAGEPVYLIDRETKDTAWRAITDNTGKAELWGSFDAKNSNQTSYSIVCAGQTNFFPATFENGINRITVQKNCIHSNIADIAFVVDATGSMSDEIKYLQDELEDVINNVSAKNKGVDLRIGSVFYRDRNDAYLTRSSGFQSDLAPTIQFINDQSAAGGGDYPEAVEEALTAALDTLHWDTGARAKILFLVLDAPPHNEAKDKMKKLMIQAASMGVRIVPVVCSGIDKSAEYLMRSLALATNGSYVFLTDDSGVGNKHIKPTTDDFKVELLNDLLQRLISEMIYMASCDGKEKLAMPINPDNNIAKVTVYPNPSAGKIRIKCSEKIKDLLLTDFTGKVLERIDANLHGKNWQTDLSRYPSGTYLIRYLTELNGWGAEKVLLIK